jgi:3-keto-disaccharide hydrolase
MKRLSAIISVLLVVAFTITGCWMTYPDSQRWVVLIDGDKGLENWNRIGDANWRAEGGAIVADKGKGGHLVSKKSYKNFELRAEFWADHTTNSGIFIRCSDANKITATNAYEVNIYDQRPGPEYGTGAIVNFAMVNPMPKAGGKWNEYVIRAEGSTVTVILNGQATVVMNDGKFAAGPFTLQYGAGPKGAQGGAIKWRKVQIKELS